MSSNCAGSCAETASAGGMCGMQISDWRRDHTWRPEDGEQPETYLVQQYVEAPYLVGVGLWRWGGELCCAAL